MLPIVIPERRPCDEALIEDVIDFLDANEYGLRNSVWTGDDLIAQTVRRRRDERRPAEDQRLAHRVRLLPLHPRWHRQDRRTRRRELNYVGLRTTHLQGVCWGDGDPRPLDPRVASIPTTGRS